MKKSMNLIDRVKSGAKTLAVGAAIGLSTFAYSPKAEAGIINSFADFMGNEGIFYEVKMDDSPSNLMIRDSEGIDSVVSKNGAEVWRIGFIKYDGDNMFIGGYANNNNYSSNTYGGYEGWCGGLYTGAVLSDGTVDDVLIIHDKLGNGIGDFSNGIWTYGADDVHYWTKDIMFNGIQGDLSQLGTFEGDKILPQMTINQVPEPRTGPSNMVDLEAFAYYWLSTDCMGANGDCEGADWNYDGTVNLQDFAYMAQGWDLN